MKIEIDIPPERITDLLQGHSYDASPWIHDMSGDWRSPEGLTVTYDNEDEEEGEGQGAIIIREPQVQQGFPIFIKECKRHFGEFLCEHDDAETFDCFIQCIIFGKLIYG